jgi:hypothetical protein
LKKFILISWLALLPLVPCSSSAQDDDKIQAPTEKTDVGAPAAQQTPAPAKFYFEVDQNDLAAISQALSELPKRVADPLILRLNGQLAVQAQATIAPLATKALEPKKKK